MKFTVVSEQQIIIHDLNVQVFLQRYGALELEEPKERIKIYSQRLLIISISS
jgi:hypothetical protein